MIHTCLYQKKIKNQIIYLLFIILILTMGTSCKKELDVEAEKEKIANNYPIDKNIENYTDLLEKVKKQEGEYSENVIILNCNLAAYSNLSGLYEDAENYLREAKICIDELKLDRPPADEYYYVYAQVERLKGNYEKSLEYLEQALLMRKNYYGEFSQETGILYLSLTNTYMEMENYDNAEEYAHLALRPSYEGENWIWVINANIILGDIDFKRENYMDAYSYYEDSQRALENHFGRRTTMAAVILAEIYEKKANTMYAQEGYEKLGVAYDVESYRYMQQIPEYYLEAEIVKEKEEELFSLWKQYYESDDRKEFNEWFKNRLEEGESGVIVR